MSVGETASSFGEQDEVIGLNFLGTSFHPNPDEIILLRRSNQLVASIEIRGQRTMLFDMLAPVSDEKSV